MSIPDGAYSIVPHWLLDRVGIGRNELVTYLVLDSYANNETREAWPSIPTIASRIGVSRRSVVRDAIGMLERQAIIDIERRYRGQEQARSSNRYVVHRVSPEARGIISHWTPHEKAAAMIASESPEPERKKARQALLDAMSAGISPMDLLLVAREAHRRDWPVTSESLEACRKPQAA